MLYGIMSGIKFTLRGLPLLGAVLWKDFPKRGLFSSVWKDCLSPGWGWESLRAHADGG